MKSKYEVKPKKVKLENGLKSLLEGEDSENMFETDQKNPLIKKTKLKTEKGKIDVKGTLKRKNTKNTDEYQSDGEIEVFSPPKKSKINKVFFFV